MVKMKLESILTTDFGMTEWDEPDIG